jgi:hypothetical protein
MGELSPFFLLPSSFFLLPHDKNYLRLLCLVVGDQKT